MAKFNLHGDIDNFDNFITNLIEKIGSVPDNEPIELNISSFGGDVMMGMPLGEALLRHKGKVKMVVDGMSGSMGAILLTYADEAVATEGASFMFHKATSRFGDKSPGSVKVLSNVNTNFKNRMIERGIDAELIRDVFEKDLDIFLSAFEAKKMGVIDSVIKNERSGNNPFQRIVATFSNQFKNKKMAKTKEEEVSKIVFIALMDKDGNPLTTAFQTPSGVIQEGTMLLPLNGQQVVAGVYSFEGSRLTVDETGKITAIEDIPEGETSAEKDNEDDRALTAEAVGEIVNTAIEKAMGSMQAKVETSLQGKMEAALKNIGTDFKVDASFEALLDKDTISPSEKVQGMAAEKALKAKVSGKK